MPRRPSIILWLATYTAITLCSPGLHELTGDGHGRVAAPVRTDAGPGMQGDPSSATVSATVDPASDDGHCPVCSYLAQAQAAPDAASTAVAGRVAFAPGARTSAGPRAVPSLPSRPRAPPRPTPAHA